MAAHRNNSDRLLEESEERYRRLVEASPEAIFVYLDGRIAYVNPAGTKLFGARKPEELLGKSILDFIHPEYREVVKARLRKVEEEGEQASSLEQRLVRPDGRVVYVEATSLPIVYEGRPAIQALIRDITERKRASEELRESEARNRAILDASPDLMFLVNRAGEIHDFRAQDNGKLYVPPDRIVGSKVSDALPAGIAGAALRHVERVLDSNETQTFEYRLPVPDGLRDFEARIVASGEDEALVVVRDITGRRSMEEELRRSEECFRTAFESTSTGVALISLDRRFLRVNPALCEILGYPEEELLGKSTGEVTHPEDLEASRLRRERALQSGADRHALEKRYVRSDGRTVWVLSDLSVVRNDEGSPAISSPTSRTSPSASGPRRSCARTRSGSGPSSRTRRSAYP